jgi:hypothetical protein
MAEPDLRTMASVLAALGDDGLADDQACLEALLWARYSRQNIARFAPLARQLARHFRHTRKARIARRERLRRQI